MATNFKPCSVDGCNGNSAREKGGRAGMCKKHRWRVSKYGEPEPDRPWFNKSRGVCSIPGCGRKGRLTRTWCDPHYKRWLQHGDPNAGRTPVGEAMRYLLAHMWEKGCLPWPYQRCPQGYARIDHEGRNRLAHDIVCEMVNGPRPGPEYDAAHECGNGRSGCFSAHCVTWKTRGDNAKDTIRHGRSIRGVRHHNHILTPEEVMEISDMRPLPCLSCEGSVETASRYSVHRQTIADIWQGRTWGWLTGRSPAIEEMGA